MNNVKILLSLIILMASVGSAEAKLLHLRDVIPASAFREGGGGAVGNGGGTVVCRHSDQTIQSISLLDYFEASLLRGVKIDIDQIPGDYYQKAKAVIARLGKQSQLREKIYSKWLDSFASEHTKLVGVEFNNIPDAMHIGVPKGCKFEQAAVQIIPRFPGDQRYYINDELWKALDDSGKAGLVLHELVYREALSYGHNDSVATRYFVGLISSSQIEKLSADQFLDTLEQVKFEQTDIAADISLAQMKVKFKPIFWWRINELDSRTYPEAIELTGRLIINVGHSQNGGWESYRSSPMMSGTICSGLESITLPGNSKPIEVAYMGNFKAQKECRASYRYGKVGFQGQGFSIVSERADHGLPFTYEYAFGKIISATELYFHRDDSLAFIPTSAKTSGFATDWIQAHARNELGSMLLLFRENKIISASVGDDSKIDVTAQLKDREVQFVMTQNSVIDFDSKGEMLARPKMSSIASHWAMWGCKIDSSEKCLNLLSDLKLQVLNGEGTFYPDGRLQQQSSCAIQDGVYELHPGTVIPRTVMITQECILPATLDSAPDLQMLKFREGTVLFLNPKGFVTSFVGEQ